MIKESGYGAKVPEKKDIEFENMFENMPEIQELTEKSNIKQIKRDTSVSCLIIGIIGQFLWLFPLFGMIIGILGFVLSINGIKTNFRKGMSVTGLVLSIVCINLSIINLMVEIIIAQSQCNHNMYC